MPKTQRVSADGRTRRRAVFGADAVAVEPHSDEEDDEAEDYEEVGKRRQGSGAGGREEEEEEEGDDGQEEQEEEPEDDEGEVWEVWMAGALLLAALWTSCSCLCCTWVGPTTLPCGYSCPGPSSQQACFRLQRRVFHLMLVAAHFWSAHAIGCVERSTYPLTLTPAVFPSPFPAPIPSPPGPLSLPPPLGLGAASIWKAGMLQRAAALFSARATDLFTFVYGRSPSTQAGGGSDDGVDGMDGSDGEEDDDDLFKPVKRKTEAQAANDLEAVDGELWHVLHDFFKLELCCWETRSPCACGIGRASRGD